MNFQKTHQHDYDVVCQRCGSRHVHHGDKICPNCTHKNSHTLSHIDSFVETVVKNMKKHKKQFGRYMPEEWSVSTVSDKMQKIIFEAFDDVEISRRRGKEKERILAEVQRLMPFEPYYIKHHAKEIATAVYDHLKTSKGPIHHLIRISKKLFSKNT